MRRAALAALAIVACLAAAGPASAQEPTPGTSVVTTVTCDSSNNPLFRTVASGFNPGETYGVMIVDSNNVGRIGGTGSDRVRADGTFEVGGGADLRSGTYTVYAYTGPFQTFIGLGGGWEGSIEVETFDPSLTTAWNFTTVEVTCGPSDMDDCKLGGYGDSGYRNQGQCVRNFTPARS
jgi:hypothetical protein